MSAHHYELAHHALRKVCSADPLRFFQLISSPERTSFLGWVWTKVRKKCDPGGDPGFEITDLEVDPAQILDHAAFIFKFPLPKKVPEAYLAAVVLQDHALQSSLSWADGFRYFTLERGEHLDGSPRTVFCEWTADERHLNYGEGPPANSAAFLGRVGEFLMDEL